MKSVIKLFLFITLSGFAAVSCNWFDKKEPVPGNGNLILSFENFVNNQPVKLNTEKYINANNDEFDIRDLRYYISNVKLRKAEDHQFYAVKDSYYLIEVNESTHIAEKELANIPVGEYDAIEFSIGVDALKNTSLDNEGDLDPSNAMAWDWNTGYKFLLLEGNYFKQDSVKGLVMHIGKTENYKTFTFDLKSLNQPNLVISDAKTSSATIYTEISQLFENPNLIRFSEKHSFMGSPSDTLIGENYSEGFFTLKKISNNIE